MPVVKLFIEGNLESEVLTPIFSGDPLLQQGGSKNSLRPRARAERDENKVAAGYLRDRDFDFDPPVDLAKPTVDRMDGDTPFGWRWCRHEIENYLIDPVFVGKAMEWPVAEVEDAIRQSAMRIRTYEAARWTIGVVRRSLPPHFELNTRPDDLREIAVPTNLDLASVSRWALDSIADHCVPIANATVPLAVQTLLNNFVTQFDDVFVADVSQVLVWFSGKDLIAGMTDWLVGKGIANPGAFRGLMRDWIIANPEQALVVLPEWNALRDAVRA